ncbi:CRISPR-associated endoribonuclease Cas6 [Calorimonas adulescens]|uniref:CRISPR-associated endoribonuclease Cas6 n=1 Tax=Calorimonas adulescens TaxID=2606906 RepID=UPI0013968DCF|nr:CRISPR-associated endoribonuclease Cas6 [Calorimonas adulescens]
MWKIRVEISFTSNNELVLPLNYNHILQAFIYKNITDKAYAKFLHDRGYEVYKKTFKLFTFGRLEGRFRIFPGRIMLFPPLKLVVSSAVDDFINDFCETLLKRDDQQLLDQKVFVESLSVYDRKIRGNEITIKMLSPLVMYSTVDIKDKKFTYYYSPWDKDISGMLKTNLIKKYMAISGCFPGGQDFDMDTIGPKDNRYQKIINYEGTVIKGWMGIYKIKGSPELLKVAYDCGLGSKSSMGFGCCEILEGGERDA